jgi:hypothetical protein
MEKQLWLWGLPHVLLIRLNRDSARQAHLSKLEQVEVRGGAEIDYWAADRRRTV